MRSRLPSFLGFVLLPLAFTANAADYYATEHQSVLYYSARAKDCPPFSASLPIPAPAWFDFEYDTPIRATVHIPLKLVDTDREGTAGKRREAKIEIQLNGPAGDTELSGCASLKSFGEKMKTGVFPTFSSWQSGWLSLKKPGTIAPVVAAQAAAQPPMKTPPPPTKAIVPQNKPAVPEQNPTVPAIEKDPAGALTFQDYEIVIYTADWCPNCRALEKALKKESMDTRLRIPSRDGQRTYTPSVRFIDADKHPEGGLGKGIPEIQLRKNGQTLGFQAGYAGSVLATFQGFLDKLSQKLR